MGIDVKNDFNIDADKIEPVITSKTKAIMPVHLSGWMADMPKIMKIAEAEKIIEQKGGFMVHD